MKSVLLLTSLICALTCLSACAVTDNAGQGVDNTESIGATCGVDGAEACESQDEWPVWTLEDIQPQSERYGESYGLDAFSGKYVFVAFLVGWCPYCRSQAAILESFRTDAEFENVEFVVVHGISANNAEHQSAILTNEDGTPRHGMVTFQDTEAVDAWSIQMGSKDDFFIYGPDGALKTYLPGGQQTNLSTQEGKDYLRQSLRQAMEE